VRCDSSSRRSEILEDCPVKASLESTEAQRQTCVTLRWPDFIASVARGRNTFKPTYTASSSCLRGRLLAVIARAYSPLSAIRQGGQLISSISILTSPLCVMYRRSPTGSMKGLSKSFHTNSGPLSHLWAKLVTMLGQKQSLVHVHDSKCHSDLCGTTLASIETEGVR
jgi:hypothetical protein